MKGSDYPCRTQIFSCEDNNRQYLIADSERQRTILRREMAKDVSVIEDNRRNKQDKSKCVTPCSKL